MVQRNCFYGLWMFFAAIVLMPSYNHQLQYNYTRFYRTGSQILPIYIMLGVYGWIIVFKSLNWSLKNLGSGVRLPGFKFLVSLSKVNLPVLLFFQLSNRNNTTSLTGLLWELNKLNTCGCWLLLLIISVIPRSLFLVKNSLPNQKRNLKVL